MLLQANIFVIKQMLEGILGIDTLKMCLAKMWFVF